VDPGVAAAVVRGPRGLVACLGPDPAPSPWGFVSGVGAQTGRLVVDRRGGFGEVRWVQKIKSQGREEENRNGGGGRWGAAGKQSRWKDAALKDGA
jgi:hypothetical protein